MRAVLKIAALAACAAACGPSSTFECSDDSQCQDKGVQGRCEANGFCSFPDPTCPSGRRFSALAGDVANMCVPELFDTDQPPETSEEEGPDPVTSGSSAPPPTTSDEVTSGSTDAPPPMTDSSTGEPCVELCLDYQPQWQLPIQDSFTQVLRDPGGALLIVGGYNAETSVGSFDLPWAGDSDLYIGWMDDDGNVDEVVTHSSVGSTWLLGLAVDPASNLFVAGAYTGSPDFGSTPLPDSGFGGYVVSFDDAGEQRWLAAMPGGRTWAVAQFGNSVVATGDFTSSVTLGADTLVSGGNTDGYISRLDDETGGFLLNHHITGPDIDAATDLVTTGGGFVAIGMFSDMVSGGGDTVAAQGVVDGFMQRLTVSAVPEWTRSFSADAVDFPFIDADAAGNLYLIAMFEGTVEFDDGISYDSTVSDDIVIAKLGPDGAREWSHAIPTSGSSRSWTAAANADGRVAFAFDYGSATTVAGQDFVAVGERDGIVVMYDTDGTPQWVTTYAGDLEETGAALMLEDNGDLTAVYSYQSATLDIGLGDVPGPGDGMRYAALVVRYPSPD